MTFPFSISITVGIVISYDPALPNITRTQKCCRNVVKNLPLVAYRWCKNISDILVRAQSTGTHDSSDSRATPGSFQCNTRNCATCPYIEHGRNQYTFHSTGETYHIKSYMTCTTFNVIYIIQCRLCNLRYIGESKRRLKDRFKDDQYSTLLLIVSGYSGIRTLSQQ